MSGKMVFKTGRTAGKGFKIEKIRHFFPVIDRIVVPQECFTAELFFKPFQVLRAIGG